MAHTVTLPASAVFSHLTAAALHNLPLTLSAGTEPLIHVTVPVGTRAPRRKGLRGHQRELAADEIVRIGRLRATSLARTFADLAELLDVGALVAVGDRMLWRERPLAGLEQLVQAVDGLAGRRGYRTARAALELLDDGAESPKETELRLLLRTAGFGPFSSNFELFDGRGTFVARVDLALADLRIAIEYEGDHHRDKDQWRRDIARRRRIEALGWTYIPVTQADLTDPANLFADLAGAIVRRG